MRATAITAALLLSASVCLAQSRPISDSARSHLERGVASYLSGSYDAAIAAFQAGLKIEEHPDLYYALAQAERKRGNCAGAIAAYREFLRFNPPATEAQRAELNIKRCEQATGAEPSARPAPSTSTEGALPAVVAPPSSATSAPQPIRSPREQPSSDGASRTGVKIAGVGVVAVGGVLFGLGTYFAVRSADDWSTVNDVAARHESWSADHQRTYDRAAGNETNATILFVAGGAAVAIGAVLYSLAVLTSGNRSASNRLRLDPGGARGRAAGPCGTAAMGVVCGF